MSRVNAIGARVANISKSAQNGLNQKRHNRVTSKKKARAEYMCDPDPIVAFEDQPNYSPSRMKTLNIRPSGQLIVVQLLNLRFLTLQKVIAKKC
jgi:hypothetical protein